MEKKLFVGLGNPGREYEFTRHNLGFLVAQYIADSYNANLKLRSLIDGFVGEIENDHQKILILKPLTFMNRSGLAVKKIMAKEGIDLGNILVISDDFHLDFGQIRIKAKGSDGGHNGLGSIIDYLGTNEFNRLRLGIGYPDRQDPVDYVLQKFTPHEKSHLEDFIIQAHECCLCWLSEGITRTMDRYNRKASKQENDN